MNPTDTLKTLPRSITVIGRRWYQRKYGNTYHSAEIIIDGVTVHKTPAQYGHGSAYEDTAAAWLDKSGLVPPRPQYANGSTAPAWQFYRGTLWIAYYATPIDVRRERDL